ncbi:uncharacterized protein LOC124280120 [Haliotis rubra]|uniref:uncharacterized protein LOC124280120 n=1 Tax=Haliotis rubra TaxID=36100 RepID=UPI001EE5CADB|nr:uncharacterized protein LOC124280120 [Haliotis rubra]
MVLSSIPDTPETSLPLVVGSSVASVIVTLGIIAGLILSRLNRLRDYWHLRFRSYITPMQNMPEHIDDGEYAEIDDADLTGLGAGNIVNLLWMSRMITTCAGGRGSRWKVRMMTMKR